MVKAGKARYIGASSMQLRSLLRPWNYKNSTAGRSLISLQDHYNLILSRRRARDAATVLSGGRGGDSGTRWRGGD
ncbi:hypothetical protein ACNKHX_02150 [Shigella flexneri]